MRWRSRSASTVSEKWATSAIARFAAAGEPGLERSKLRSAGEIVDLVLDMLANSERLKLRADEPLVFLLNNLGATSKLEMNILQAEIVARAREWRRRRQNGGAPSNGVSRCSRTQNADCSFRLRHVDDEPRLAWLQPHDFAARRSRLARTPRHALDRLDLLAHNDAALAARRSAVASPIRREQNRERRRRSAAGFVRVAAACAPAICRNGGANRKSAASGGRKASGKRKFAQRGKHFSSKFGLRDHDC